MSKIMYAGIAFVLSFLSVLEARADNPFANFKPYEQDNSEGPETTQPADTSEMQHTE